MPPKVAAAERAALRRLGLRPPPYVPGEPPGGGWLPPLAWLRAAVGRTRGDPRALRRDLPWLATVLAASYAGWTGAEARGWDWPAFFRRWNRQLRRLRHPAPTADLFAPWREFLAFQPDGHTGPLAPLGVSRGSQTLLVAARARTTVTAVRLADGAERKLPADAADRLLAVGVSRNGTLRRGAMIALPAVWGPVAEVKVGRRWIRAEVVGGSGRVSGRPAIQRLKPGVVYVRIPTLSANNAAALRRLAARRLPPVPPGGVLVADLRGNLGGDHTAGLDLLRRLLPGVDWKKTAPTPVRRLDSSWVRALRWGFARLHLAGGRGPLPAGARASLQQMLDEFDVARIRGVLQFDESVPLPAPRAAAGRAPRVLVLADGRTGSDAELLVWMLRRLPGTMVAGANTFGAAQFIRPGVALLPHSRLAFCVATAETDLYGDGRPVDGRGLPVDIVLPDAAARTSDSICNLARRFWFGGSRSD